MKGASFISRIAAVGFGAVLLSILLWPLESRFDIFFWPQAGLGVMAAACGGAVLALTAFDILFSRRRGRRVGPIRAFDVACGLGLVGFAYLQLDWLAGQLPA